jgi:uncharacterized protein (DUF58 family)
MPMSRFPHQNRKPTLDWGRLFQVKTLETSEVKLTQRRIFIVPTASGMTMALLIVLLLLLAYVYANNLVYMLAFLLASIFFITPIHTYKALAGLYVKAGQLKPVFAGEAASFQLRISNPDGEARFNLKIKLESEQSFDIGANESIELTLFVPTQQRGWQTVDRIHLSSRYPFGVYHAWSSLRFGKKFLVYPKPSDLSLPLPLGPSGEDQANDALPAPGHDDFDSLRCYERGDSLRRIHWQAYARGLGLLSKQYISSLRGTEISLDYASAPGANKEERLSVLCRWVIESEQAGLCYALRVPGNVIEANSGNQHFQACLQALALVE